MKILLQRPNEKRRTFRWVYIVEKRKCGVENKTQSEWKIKKIFRKEEKCEYASLLLHKDDDEKNKKIKKRVEKALVEIHKLFADAHGIFLYYLALITSYCCWLHTRIEVVALLYFEPCDQVLVCNAIAIVIIIIFVPFDEQLLSPTILFKLVLLIV